MKEDPGPQTERFKREKLELIKKRGSFCEYCGEKDPDKLTFHHANPARDGGARRNALMPNTPLEYCPVCNCYYYDITGKKLCPHEKDYPVIEHNIVAKPIEGSEGLFTYRN